MTRSLATLAALVLTTAPAFAHPGHLLEGSHGHVHWDEILIFAGVAAVVAGFGLARLYRRRRRRPA